MRLKADIFPCPAGPPPSWPSPWRHGRPVPQTPIPPLISRGPNTASSLRYFIGPRPYPAASRRLFHLYQKSKRMGTAPRKLFLPAAISNPAKVRRIRSARRTHSSAIV